MIEIWVRDADTESGMNMPSLDACDYSVMEATARGMAPQGDDENQDRKFGKRLYGGTDFEIECPWREIKSWNNECLKDTGRWRMRKGEKAPRFASTVSVRQKSPTSCPGRRPRPRGCSV